MSDNNFDFLMSLQIETGSAIQKISDVWSAMRQLASKSVELKLEINADYKQALRGLDEAKRKMDQLSKSAEDIQKEADMIGQRFESALRKASSISDKAAKDLKEAFDTDNVDRMTQALEMLGQRAKNLGTGHLKEFLRNQGSKLGTINSAAGTASGISASDLAAMRKAQEEVVKAAKGLAGTQAGTQGQAQADKALRDAQTKLRNVADALGSEAAALEVIFSTLAEFDQEIKEIELAAKRAAKNHDRGREKEINLTLEVAKQYRAVIDRIMQGDTANIGTALRDINSGVKAALENQLERMIEEVGTAVHEAFASKNATKAIPNLPQLRAEALATYEKFNTEVLDIMSKVAFESLGPAIAHFSPRIAAKMRGAFGGKGGSINKDFLSQIMGALGGGGNGGGSGPIGVDGGFLIQSISKVITEGNASDAWPHLQLRVHQAALKDSILAGVAAAEAEIGPFAAAAAAAGVGAAGGRARARRPRAARAAPPADADSGLSAEDLWAKYGPNPVRPSRRQTESERAHNEAVKEARRADKNSQRERARQNPIDLIREYAPGLVGMAETIKSAKEFTPAAGEQDLAMQKLKEAKELMASFFRQLYEEAANLSGKGNARGASALNNAGVAFRSQYATRIDDLLSDKSDAAKRRAIRDAEAAADARQAYADTRSMFQRGVYSDIKDAPLDRYKDRMDAYRRMYELARNYERELVAYTHARNEEEAQIANRRINGAMRELEIQRDVLNTRLLTGLRGQVSMRKFTSELRADETGSIYAQRNFSGQRENLNLKDAYGQTASLLNEELRPALEHLNATMRNLQREDLVNARAAEVGGDKDKAAALYARAAAHKPLDFGGMLSSIQQGGGQAFNNIAEAVAKTMRFSAEEEGIYKKLLEEAEGLKKAEEYRNSLAKTRLVSLMDEVNIYNNKLLPAVEKQRAEIALLDRYDRVKANQQRDPNGLKRAARGLSNTFGFYAGGMMIGFMAQSAFREAIQYQKDLAEIQGVLANKSPSDARKIGDAVTSIAMKYGASLKETAEAAKVLAQTGLNATQIVTELNATMLGMRGLGITIQQMQELQVAIHSVQEEMGQTNKEFISSAALVEKMSHVESQYAVSAQNLADALKISAPFIKNFTEGMRGKTDFVDITSGITTVMVERLRVSGGQAGNALKTTLSRLLRPEILGKLQQQYGLKLGTTQGAMLPLDEVFGEISKRYKEMKQAGGPASLKADQMLAQLAGAHRVNFIAAVLNNYDQALKIAEQSANSFGEAQMRADLVMDTLGSKVQQARNAFQLFANDLLQNSIVAEGLKGALEGVAAVLGTLAGGVGGYGSGIAGLAGIVGSTLAVKGVVHGARRLDIAKMAYQMGTPYSELRNAIDARRLAETADRFGGGVAPISLMKGEARAAQAVGRGASALTGVFGRLVNFIGPVGVILLGFTALLAIFGALHRALNGRVDDEKKYGIRVKTALESGVYDSPQYNNLKEQLATLGYRNVQQGIHDVRDAMISPQASYFPAKYGAENFTELMDRVRRGQMKNGPEVANQVINAVVNSPSLSDEAREKIKGMANEGERLAYVTKLIGNMAFAATWQITQAIAMARDSIDRQSSDIMSGTQRLDVERERTNRFSRVVGSFMDTITGRRVLTSPVAMRIYGGSQEQTLSRAHNAIGDFFGAAGMPVKQREGLLTSNGFFIQAMDQTIAAFDKAGRVTVSTGELLSGTFQKLKDMQGDVTIRDYLVDKTGKFREGTHVGTPYDAVVDQAAKASLSVTSFKSELKRIDPTFYGGAGEPSNAGAVQEVNEFETQVAARAKELLEGVAATSGNVISAQDVQSMAEFVKQQRHMFLALNSGAQYITVFKDKLLDLVLSLHTELAKLDAADKFAERHGKAFDRESQMMSIAQQYVEQLDIFPETMAAEYTKKAQELANTNVYNLRFGKGGQIVGADGKVIDLTEGDDPNAPDNQTKAVARRMQQLASELQQMEDMYNEMTGGLYKLSQSFPNNPISQKILADLKKLQGPGDTNVFHDLSEGLHGEYGINQNTLLQRRLRLLGGTGRVRGAENRADIGRLALDVEANMTKKTETRLAIAKSLLNAHIADLQLQVDERTLDVDQAKYQEQELRQEFELTTEHERQVQLQEHRNDLQRQGLENLKGMIDGVMGAVGNLDIWASIFSVHGPDRKQAINNYVAGIFKSVSEPLSKRMSENLSNALQNYLQNFDGLMNVMKSPEHKMKADVTEAGQLVSANWSGAIVNAGEMVAQRWQAVIDSIPTGFGGAGGVPPTGTDSGIGSDAGLGQIVAGMGTTAAGTVAVSSINSPLSKKGNPAVVITSDGNMRDARTMKIVPDSFIKSVIGKGKGGFWDKYNKNAPTTAGQQVVAGLGSYGGQLLGTAFGHGREGAQIGSSLGATGGAILGQALIPIPGVGAAIGGLVGGSIGGIFGGLFHGKDRPDREINHLEAIEFATRETVSAIEQQTDKLRKPDASLLYLPTGFTVPSYTPQFAGGGGLGGVSLERGAVTVNVGGTNLSSSQIQSAVEKGMAIALSNGRTGTPRTNSKY